MSKKRVYSLIKPLVSLTLLVVVLARTGWRNVVHVLTTGQLVWFGLAIGVYAAGVLIRAVRWRILLGKPATPSLGRLTAMYFVSFFFNSFLPTGIGGDVVRVAEVARSTGVSTAASSVIADRTIGLLSASLLALLVLPLPGNRVNPLIALVAGVIAVGTPAMFWFLARYATAGLNTLSRTLPFLRPVASHRQVHEFIAALTAYSPRDLVQAFVVSLVFAISNAVTYACIGVALHIDLPLAYYVLVSPIITLVLLIPISVNGLGTRDAAYQVLFIPAGVTSDGALAMSLAYHALNLLAAIAGGVVYVIIGTSETLTKSERL